MIKAGEMRAIPKGVLTFILVALSAIAWSQTPALTTRDKNEIRAAAKNVIEQQLKDLYNSIASEDFGKQEIALIIANSFIPSENQIFDLMAFVEDDLNPDNTKGEKGHAEKKVKQYLDDFNMFYKKDKPNSVKITGISIEEAKQGKDFIFVPVHFYTHFTNAHKTKPTPYQQVYRTAELKAEKHGNEWKLLITSLRFYQEPKPEENVVTQTIAQVKKEAPPVPKETPKTTGSAGNQQTVEKEIVGTTPVTSPAADQKPKPEEKLITRQAPSPNTSSGEARVQPGPVSSRNQQAPDKEDASLKALETRMNKAKRNATLYKALAGAGIVGAGATFVIVNGAYGDYKSQLEKTNQAHEAFYQENMNGTQVPDDELAKPKSLLSFGSPGIYFVGAGILAGGALWLLGSNSGKQYRSLKSELEQKRKSLSFSPQASVTQRYAGISLKYKF